jgi:hypothetical protein
VAAVAGTREESATAPRAKLSGVELVERLAASLEPLMKIIIHLLGLAPAGYLAAPDSGPRAGCGVVHAKYPFVVTVVTLCH